MKILNRSCTDIPMAAYLVGRSNEGTKTIRVDVELLNPAVHVHRAQILHDES
jgi:hypothetical protein